MLRRVEQTIRSRLGPEAHARFKAAFYDRAYGTRQWPELSTLNYGYAPVDDTVAAAWPNEPHQIQLYEEALKTLRKVAPGLAPHRLLEICCGRGGGLAHVVRALNPLHAIGLDRALPALDYARGRNSSAGFLVADVPRLPLRDRCVDVIFNIEAMNSFDRPTFFAEMARILARGGYFVTAESFPWTPDRVRDEFTALAQAVGMELANFRDVTANVHLSCIADEKRRRYFIRRMPILYRPFGREFVCLPGSPRFRQFANRERCYFIGVFHRPV